MLRFSDFLLRCLEQEGAPIIFRRGDIGFCCRCPSVPLAPCRAQEPPNGPRHFRKLPPEACHLQRPVRLPTAQLGSEECIPTLRRPTIGKRRKQSSKHAARKRSPRGRDTPRTRNVRGSKRQDEGFLNRCPKYRALPLARCARRRLS
eukprot:6453584-Pyramimonas_sp.AAC.1